MGKWDRYPRPVLARLIRLYSVPVSKGPFRQSKESLVEVLALHEKLASRTDELVTTNMLVDAERLLKDFKEERDRQWAKKLLKEK